MVISKTPYRVSFFGGGTDYPNWYLHNGGAVISTTIDKYCHINCRYLPPFFSHKYLIRWSQIEMVNSISEIEHPSIRACLDFLDINEGVSIVHDGDLPARSGMGSSSSFNVGMLNALYSMLRQPCSKENLLQQSIHIEQKVLKEIVGAQDQTAAVYGGLNHIEFEPSGQISVNPLEISSVFRAELESHLMLFFTGFQRNASDIASTYVAKLTEKSGSLRTLRSMVYECISILQNELPIRQFGKLLHQSWEIKRKLGSTISSNRIDALYDSIMSAGALGGKIMGAGGGGFLLVCAEPNKQERIRYELRNLVYVPFKFEDRGTHILVSN